jgi:hypothetical protein
MPAKILIAWCLVATTVSFHATALGIVLNPVLRLTAQLETRFLAGDLVSGSDRLMAHRNSLR